MKFKKVSSWSGIQNDPRVSCAYVEYDECWNPDTGESRWVELKGEYINTYSDTRYIHECTVAQCLEQLNLMVREATAEELKEWNSPIG
jgi:hypothetical protein